MRQFEVRPCTNVTETLDWKAGSLRFAIDCAQPGDTVFISDNLVGDTIRLEDTIGISKDITIWNTNIGEVTIAAPGVDHLFTISDVASVKMNHLSMVAGNGSSGRVVVNYGSLEIENSKFYDNIVEPTLGSLILNQGFLTVKENVQLLFIPD
jgi:hypothetical protein